MEKKHDSGNQRSSSKQVQKPDTSPVVPETEAVTPFRVASKIDPRKKILDELTDDTKANDGHHRISGESAADTDQPALVEQQSADAVGEGSSGGGAILATNTGALPGENVLLALADGAGSGAGGASPGDGGSGSSTGWWLAGGLAAVGGGAIAAASGGSGGSPGTTATTVSGNVTDGPVQGARLYYDLNGNGTYDEGTDTPVLGADGNQVVTDADGNFSFSTTSNPATIRLVANGGIDTVTGDAVTVDFAAPAGYTQINPITSAIAAYMESNPAATAAQAEAAVETALGLPDLDYSSVNLANPPTDIPADDLLAAQRAAAIIATAALAVEESGADADAFNFVAENLGSGGSTDTLVSAVLADPNVAGTDVETKLSTTVDAISEADTLDQVWDAQVTMTTDAPVIPPPSIGDLYSVNLPEHSANGTVVETITAIDADNDPISYRIVDGSGAFAIDAASGVITVADASQLDYEMTPSLTLTVEASDGTFTDTCTVEVTLADVNDNSPVFVSGDSGGVSENAVVGTVIYQAAATDADQGSSIVYSLAEDGDAALLEIDPTSGAVTLKEPADFETKNLYQFAVLANDGQNVGGQVVAVDVYDENENPVIVSNGGGATAAISVAENQTAVTTVTATDPDAGDGKTFSITGGVDQALFTINPATGALSFLSSRNFESPADAGGNNVYDVQVTVTDSGGLTDVQDLAVTITDLNDSIPVITSGGTGSVAENAATSTVIYDAAATDADAGSTITYSLKAGTGDVALLNIDSSTGQVTLKNSADFETKAAYTFTVIASDGTNSSEQAVTVTVTNLNDNTPVITSGGTGSVAENAAADTVIYDAAATDADAGSTITYSLKPEGADFSLINIDSSTGQVRLNNPANFEAKTSYTFTVIASDGTSSSEQAVTVSVANVNESITITSNGGGASASVTIAENVTSVTTVTATDIDAGDSKTFSISGGADQALFAIDPSTGALTFLAAPDFETPGDAGGNNIYDVQVTVTDAGGLTDVQDLAVTVTNVNEHFVVERTGAWIDVDADGFRDADETTAADFTPDTGNVDLSAIPAIIHFNNVPDGDISLAGFGADDLIEMDIQSFIDNGHNAFQILTQPNIVTLDEFTGYAQSSAGSTGNSLVAYITGTGTNVNVTGTRYWNFNSYSATSGSTRTASVGLSLFATGTGLRGLSLASNNGSSSSNWWQIASQLPADMLLQEMVDFVNLPTPPDPVHVVVERDGAFIDIDGDGILDNGENRLAGFGVGGNADLANRSVIIHLTDAPQSALNLTGFGEDDKIEIDVAALLNNGILNSTAVYGGLASFAFEGLGLLGYYFSRTTGTSSSLTTHFTWIRVNHSSAMRPDFRGTSYGPFGITLNYINTSISGRTQGLIAYWTDSSNALNNMTKLLPDTLTNTYTEILANLNANHYAGLVEFVWPVNVVIDDQAGNVASFIDSNANGMRDPGEDTLALLGQTEADVVAFNATAGTDYASQVVNLATEQVSIHYNDLPTSAWMPDLTGFGDNDRIEIDIPAMRNNLTIIDSAVLSNQGSITMRSQTQTYAGVSGVSSVGNAVYLSGGNLYFGHRASTPTSTGPSAMISAFYTATGTLEGKIAENANVLAGDFQPVIFVTDIM